MKHVGGNELPKGPIPSNQINDKSVITHVYVRGRDPTPTMRPVTDQYRKTLDLSILMIRPLFSPGCEVRDSIN